MALSAAHRNRIAGFSLPEVLVVIAVIAVLMAVLLPALTGAKRSADMAKSNNNMRQIAQMMALYSMENREHILPSQFDYTASASPPLNYPVKVRSDAALQNTTWGNLQYKGTWADILWTLNPNLVAATVDDRYRYDSPDKAIYDDDPDFDNPLRSAAPNSRDFLVAASTSGDGPKPFGTGAAEGAFPGYFAANNFFNADPTAPPDANGNPTPSIGRWYITGQIKDPSRSMYLVDSLAGETIEPLDGPFNNDVTLSPPTIEVDFRYSGACLMLFLDGHTTPQTPWTDLADLQARSIKVTRLDRK